MKRSLHLLLAEDNDNDATLILREVHRAGYEVRCTRVDNEEAFLQHLDAGLDIVLSDFQMPQFTGLRALQLLREREPDIPFILISGTIGEEVAVDAMRCGATDYLLKDRLARLGAAIERALEDAELRRERTRSLKELQLFRALVDQSHDTFEVVDPASGRFIEVNEWGHRNLGYTRAEFLGLHVWDVDPEVTCSRWPEVAEQVRRGGTLNRSDVQRRRRDGSVHPVELTARWVSLERDYIVAVVRDITERRKAEQEMQSTYAVLRAVTESSPDAVFVKDLEGRYLLFNEGAAKLVGCSVADALGHDDTAIFPPEDAAYIRERDQRVLAAGQPLIDEEVLTSGGRKRTYLATKAPYRDATGQIVGLVGISRDITERKLAEEALRESRGQLQTALASMTDAVSITDPQGRVIDFNDAFATFHRFASREECAERLADFSDVLEVHRGNGDIAAPQDWAGARALRGETGTNVEFTLRRKDTGQAWTASFSFSPLRDDAGAIVGSVVVGRDVTEARRLEQQLLRAQRMESIGTLAGGIAHDLNNALSPIILSLDLLGLRLPDEKSADLLATIGASAQHGADMVKQLLSFARGVEGRRVCVPVRPLIKEVEKIVNDTFLKTIRVTTSMPEELWPVLGDPTQLHQVLINLCVNARDAMPGGGELRLAAQNLELDSQAAATLYESKPGKYVKVEVSDTGTGIPPEMLEKIFDPFFTTKGVGQGTGLGLSTSLAIIRSHEGVMQVTSEPGRGTSFFLYLPARPDESAAPAGVAVPEVPHGHGELVLVVDDEAAVRAVARQTLEAFGYRVLVARDGVEAVTVFATRSDEVAVVVTDMMMPNMNGHATVEVLRRMNPKVRIIAASGLATHDNVVAATRLGAANFLSKPYSARTLLVAIQNVLERG